MDGVWRTINGVHVLISKDGSILKGPKALQKSDIQKRLKKQLENNKLQESLDKTTKEYYDETYPDNQEIKVSSFNTDLKELDKNWAETNIKQFAKLKEEYNSASISLEYAEDKTKPTALGKTVANDYDMNQVYLLNDAKDKELTVKHVREAVNIGHYPQMEEKNYEKCVITHEFAHSMVNETTQKYHKEAYNQIKKTYSKYKNEIDIVKKELKDAQNDMLMNFSEEKYNKAKLIQDKYDKVRISNYAYRNEDEFFAEAFTEYKLGNNISPYSKEIGALVEKYFKKGKK